MKEYLYQLIQNKNILILGYGREGESTYKTFRKYFPELIITIADLDENILNKSDALKKDKFVHFILGREYLNFIDEFDLIIKTPGISLNNLQTKVNKENITSQTNMFLSQYRNQIIGITGTKGKSTTSSLIFNIVHSFNNNSILVGNIGVPPFDMIDNIDDNTIIVCELSSHQLEYVSVSPHISILLNLFQEHLDHYNNYKDYQLSKFNIAKYQKERDFFIFHKEDELIKSLLNENKIKSKVLPYSLTENSENDVFVSNNSIILKPNNQLVFEFEISKDLFLKGDHNLLNIIAATIACKAKVIPDEYIKKGITEFKGLEHRIEYVGKYNDIIYYNDSIATIPEATIEAIKTLKNVNTIILGGFDRGINYCDLAAFLINTKIEHFIFIEKAGLRILFELNKYENINSQQYFTVKTFEEAVDVAKNKTRTNTICLLSPAAASYGMFKNFEERGRLFKELVKG